MKPRERMLEGGEKALSNAELIAILLRTGGNGKDVLELAEEIISAFPRLSDLSGASLKELMAISGVGLAKATALKAALELGKRLHEELIRPKKILKRPRDLFEFCSDMRYESREILRIIGVDNSLGYLAHRDFTSSLSSTVEVSKRDVFRFLLRVGATGFFMVHNHPTNPVPSDEDVKITRTFKRAGDLVGIRLVDHVIISPKGFESFVEKGMI